MYRESTNLAQEKGPFPKFKSAEYLKSAFVETLPEEIKQNIREKGIRNVALTTQAPTGTVGSMLGTSTGIEPYYAFKFFRQSRLGFHEVFIPLADEYKHNGDLPEFFVSAMDLSPLEHIKVQAAVQKWTDSSISKTANAPNEFTVEQTAELYIQAYELGCKGVTIYRDASRNEQVLSTDADTEKKNLEYNNKKKVKQEVIEPFKKKTEVEITEMQNPYKHLGPEVKTEEEKKEEKPKEELEEVKQKEKLPLKTEGLRFDEKYGLEVGKICPNCKQGVMVKLGGCTECSKQCGMKGACDMK